MNIGRPKRIIEIAPAELPLPDAVPVFEPDTAPAEEPLPVPAEPAEPPAAP